MAKRHRPMRSKLSPVGRVIYWTGAARFYHNGDGAGFIWRWWHPLAWIVAPLGFIASVVMVGLPETWSDKHALGFGMNPYFVKHPDKLVWAARSAEAEEG